MCVCVSVYACVCVCVPRNGGDLLNLAALTNASAWKIFWKCCKALCCGVSGASMPKKCSKLIFPSILLLGKLLPDDYIINSKRFCNTCAGQTNNKQQQQQQQMLPKRHKNQAKHFSFSILNVNLTQFYRRDTENTELLANSKMKCVASVRYVSQNKFYKQKKTNFHFVFFCFFLYSV